jgi:hypothetical protein
MSVMRAERTLSECIATSLFDPHATLAVTNRRLLDAGFKPIKAHFFLY